MELSVSTQSLLDAMLLDPYSRGGWWKRPGSSPYWPVFHCPPSISRMRLHENQAVGDYCSGPSHPSQSVPCSILPGRRNAAAGSPLEPTISYPDQIDDQHTSMSGHAWRHRHWMLLEHTISQNTTSSIITPAPRLICRSSERASSRPGRPTISQDCPKFSGHAEVEDELTCMSC